MKRRSNDIDRKSVEVGMNRGLQRSKKCALVAKGRKPV